MINEPIDPGAESTAGHSYADRLQRLENSWWRKAFNVQAPYRWNIKRLGLGYTLDIGCGLGRNLSHLGNNGVGVDHNADSIAIARSRGLRAFTVELFQQSEFAAVGCFDSLLLAHVVEHMDRDFAVNLITTYLPYLRPGGTVCLITPQERGYRTDPTHVRFVDFSGLRDLEATLSLNATREYSFPFPRVTGWIFPYNEFISLATKP